MNKAKLKSYAPQARKDFIAAVTARANLLGLLEKAGKLETVSSLPQGDVTVIAGQAWPVKVHGQREQLISRIRKDGFAQTMEAVAYTWFNRFAALRYMELHDYLGHGYRALSSQDGAQPDILTYAADLAHGGGLPGVKAALVAEMKLAGNRDSELYRMLLVAQCNALSNVMPFLFERIDDETELLLPDNLLRTDSVIAKLVGSIEEENWKEVEIIGWLYQFYISERKEEVIGRVVKREDIPAATQLFTPNWIVQYLVQNSIGRLWLMANPASDLKAQWQYYVEPACQTVEVQAQLDALVQTRMNEDGGSLHPESITLLDPACGSGHILVEAYEVLKAIYLERGYQPPTIPRLILEKNLFGLDIDDRAAQMAGFALLMKARADDRRLFNEPIKLNVLSLQESNGMDADELCLALQAGAHRDIQQITVNASGSGFVADDFSSDTRPQSFGLPISMTAMSDPAQLATTALIATFADAKTYGSLIQIPQALNVQLAAMSERLHSALLNGDLYAKAAAKDLWPLVAQAKVMGMQFDAVVANPPYMGGKGMNQQLKDFSKVAFSDTKADLFAMFMERGFGWCKPNGFSSMVTMQSWMFLSSYETMRKDLLAKHSLISLLQLPYDGKGPTAMGISFGISIVIFQKSKVLKLNGSFDCLRYFELTEDGIPAKFPSKNERNLTVCPDDFMKIPGGPVAYWVSARIREIFSKNVKMESLGQPRMGMATGNNDLHMRYWHEVSTAKTGLNHSTRLDAINSRKKWFPYNKGGAFRRWYGNNEYVVNWENDGNLLQTLRHASGRVWAHNFNLDFIFQESITWTATSSSYFSVRYSPPGFLFDYNGSSLFLKNDKLKYALGLMASNLSSYFINVLNPTIANQAGDIGAIPVIQASDTEAKSIERNVESAISLSKLDWDSFEASWNFLTFPLIANSIDFSSISLCWDEYERNLEGRFRELKRLEEENNQIFIEIYGLNDELSAEVPESQITLARADRSKDCQRLISYAIGCMMGRYSLDAPGLIYADASNVGFDATRYSKFSADTDGILPITDELWFEDDAASRIREFLLVVWGAGTLVENLTWLVESLGTKTSESPDETIRRYLADKFYKDHLQTYKKRPIYWLFSSGKQGAFQALVYMHRYNEGTLARLRAEYVVPLTGKIHSRIDMLEKDAAATSSTAARNKLAKEVEKLKKKHVELLAYDEQLRHYADMRITLNLDDGVKVNYGKFGDLLAEVKAVTGGVCDE
jgi:type II restriction/modification system DNA methylase subunit YeeA